MAKRGRKKAGRSSWGTVRMLPGGMFQASYTHGGVRGVVKATRYYAPDTFSSDLDARLWLRKEKELIDADKWKPPTQRVKEKRAAEAAAKNRMTFGEYAIQYLAHHDERATSKLRDQKSLDYYILGKPIPGKGGKPPVFRTLVGLGDVPLDELDMNAVDAWWRALPLNEYRRSCDLAYQLVRRICLYAVKRGMMEKNPCGVEGAGRASEERHMPALTSEQMKSIMDNMPDRFKPMLLLGTLCAMREGEICELRLGDVNFVDSTIHVARSVSYVERSLVHGPPKTEYGNRFVPVPPSVLAALESHIAEFLTEWNDDTLLFTDEKGRQVTSWILKKRFYSACRLAGVKAGKKDGGYVFHDLRHTGLTYYREAGASIPDLQKLAGHSTPQMVWRYQEQVPGSLKRAAVAIDAIIGVDAP